MILLCIQGDPPCVLPFLVLIPAVTQAFAPLPELHLRYQSFSVADPLQNVDRIMKTYLIITNPLLLSSPVACSPSRVNYICNLRYPC